jgi:hypothetical protein
LIYKHWNSSEGAERLTFTDRMSSSSKAKVEKRTIL